MKNLLTIFIIIVALYSCANRGTPTGGPKDETPPEVLRTEPENFSTNFNAKEIRIYFNEYVKLDNLQRQLIVSPPMDPEPTVTPLGTANKYVKIIINDTLEPNTTYAINFGQSIVDNNESNPYPFYKYVFSTGTYIDSLKISGNIASADARVTDQFVSVMLYEIDSTYSDSIIYKERPRYITNTLDSLTTYTLENLKEGKYLLVAVKDKNSNYKYEQRSDKIGFYEGIVNVPSDSIYNVKIFKEVLDFEVFKPFQVSGQKIGIPYQGDRKNLNIEIFGDSLPDNLETRLTKDKKTDTLYYWYRPKVEIDSAKFRFENLTYVDTVKYRFRDLPRDSMQIKPLYSGSLDFDKVFSLEANVPFESIDERLITILDKDSLPVSFATSLDTLNNYVQIRFELVEEGSYEIQALPNAVTSFFGEVNDTLNYSIRTKAYSDYSNVRVILNNAVYPMILQLTDKMEVVKYEKFATASGPVDFDLITPGVYYLRVIYDSNGNRKWDSGNYLEKRQPERISFYPDEIEARANWDPIIEFNLLQTSPDPPEN
ncbi:Ig-like domain-containing protein [Aegicerativicinus sediminis]|uniref:Ig-like domain-containing protein n=1 Tax=Aegicerativicinus sediminis TaxID=2893202 RepID=UPI001E4BD60C|nr:Ig-like domain-containing protein [Aegicerativicinus sediminis]